MASQTPEEILKIFNEKAARLLSLSFFSKALDSGAIISFQKSTGWDSVFVGPDEESIEALVLTLRLFMQDNEPISLKNVRGLYTTHFRPALATDFADHCARLNASLNALSGLSIEDTRRLTYRDVLEIFVYGSYAHTNPGRRRSFESLRTTAFFPLFQQALISTILVFGHCLRSLQQINVLALAESSTKESNSAV